MLKRLKALTTNQQMKDGYGVKEISGIQIYIKLLNN